MSKSSTIVVGINPSGGHKPFVYAALDNECNLLALGDGELDEVLSFLSDHSAQLVAIGAPSAPNKGVVRRKMETESHSASQLRGTDMRLAEYELRQRGISVAATPARRDKCVSWVQLGFELYHRLAKIGFVPFPAGGRPHQFLETHPHAVFCLLMEDNILPGPTLEGRLQRQLILYEQGLRITDPMDFFEEITRHRLRQGVLPLEHVYTIEQLEALAASHVAFLAGAHPEQVSFLGAEAEGLMVLPRLVP